MVRELRLVRSTPPVRRGHLAEAAATWVLGGLALIGVVVLGSVLAVVFAATLAVVVVLTLLLMAAAVLTQRSRRLKPVRAGVVIEARKVGHSWVAYGWDKDA
jgi:hypothetical protein